jgi:aminopeptidase N
MQHKRAISILFAFFFSLALSAQKQDKILTFLYDESAQPPEMLIDMIHLKAEILKIDTTTKYVETRSTYSFKVLRSKIDSLVFEIPGANVTQVKLNGLDAKHKKAGDKVVIFPNEKLAYQKEYSLMFELNTICNTGSPAFTGWGDTTQTKRRQIWGFSLNRLFPDLGVKHDLLTTELLIDFDAKYKVFSNGMRLMQRVNKNGTTTWHYKMNRNHYFGLLVFVIGDYRYETFKSDRGVPLEYWYYTDRKFAYDPTYKFSKEMFSFLEKDMGLNYPWELYRQAPVIDCPFGGMETTTSTIYNDGMQCDSREFLDRNYINVNAHELTHQWFGNYNSYTNEQNVWTSESFATYFAKKFEQAQLGEDQFQKIRLDELNRTLSASKTDDYPVGSAKGSVARWYPKGSLVIDMLRYVMGETEFKTFISYYLNKHKYAVVEWNDLKVAIRESTGRAMDWFFEEWIQKGGEPNYKISYVQSSDVNNQQNTRIQVQQVHETNALIGFFKMPVQLEVHYTDGSSDSTIAWIEKEYTEITIPNKDKKTISFVLFDPNRNVVKQVNFSRTFEELSAQLTTAKNMIDRYDALLELKKTAISKKRAILIQRFQVEKFHLIKTEIIAQLAEDNDATTFDLFRKAMNDEDVAVRRSVSANLKTIDPSLRKDVEQLLTDSSYQVIINALDNLCFNFPEQIDKYLEQTKNTDGNLFHNVRIKWLELAYEKTKDTKSLMSLREYANINQYDTPSVSAAIAALKRINYLDEVLLDYLFNAATYWSAPVNTPAKTALSFYYEQNAYRKGIKSNYKMLNQEMKEALKELIK